MKKDEKTRKVSKEDFGCIALGLYNSKFQISKIEISEVKRVVMRYKEREFFITAGPLVWRNIVCKKQYVLEIRYEKAAKELNDELPLGGFASCSLYDFALIAHELAAKFCNEHGFTLDTRFNSWPEFQALINLK